MKMGKFTPLAYFCVEKTDSGYGLRVSDHDHVRDVIEMEEFSDIEALESSLWKKFPSHRLGQVKPNGTIVWINGA